MTELKIVGRNGQYEKKTGIELVDIFDTCGQPSSAFEWEGVAYKVRRPDAEILVTAVNKYLSEKVGE